MLSSDTAGRLWPLSASSHAFDRLPIRCVRRRRSRPTDTVLICGEEEFPVHRQVLEGTSLFFQGMFRNDMIEASTGKVNLRNIEPQVMSVVLDYLYCCNVDVVRGDNVDLVKDVLQAASFLGIPTLYDHCWRLWSAVLSKTYFSDLWSTAEMFENKEVLGRVLRTVAKRFRHSSRSEDFLSLDSVQLKTLLQHCELNATADMVIESIIRWVNAGKDERKGHFLPLVKLVNLNLLSNGILATLMEEQLIAESIEVFDLLLPIYSYRLEHSDTPEPMSGTNLVCFRRIRKRNGVTEDIVLTYNLQREEWLEPQRSPIPLHQTMTFVSYEDYIIITGATNCLVSERKPSVVYHYSPQLNAVMDTGLLSCEVFAGGAAILGTTIYIIGGVDNSRDAHIVQKYDPVTRTSTDASPLPRGYLPSEEREKLQWRPSMFPIVVAAERSLFAIVGYCPTVSQYFPFSNQWTILRAFPGDVARSAVFWDRKLHFILKKQETVEVFDPVARKWQTQSKKGGPEYMQAMWKPPSYRSEESPYILFRGENHILYRYNPTYNEWDEYEGSARNQSFYDNCPFLLFRMDKCTLCCTDLHSGSDQNVTELTYQLTLSYRDVLMTSLPACNLNDQVKKPVHHFVQCIS